MNVLICGLCQKQIIREQGNGLTIIVCQNCKEALSAEMRLALQTSNEDIKRKAA